MVLVSPAGSATVVAQELPDSPAASAWAARRDSTSARKLSSCAQAWSRKALRTAGSYSRAAPTISLIFGHWSGVAMGPLHLSGQPCLGHVPVPLDGGG